jgi:hypothetical protein
MLACEMGYKRVCKLLIDAMVESIISSRSSVIAFLGIKKMRQVACLNMIDREVLKVIARLLYKPAAELRQILHDEICLPGLSDYAEEQFELRKVTKIGIDD